MKRLLWLLILVSAPIIVKAQVAGDFQSFTSGPWDDVSTWERFDGVSWVNPAPTTPTSTNGVITILAGHIVNVSAGFSVTIDQTIIASTGGLQIDATGIVTLANGTGNDLTIAGGSTLDVSGTLICSNSAVITGSTSTTTTFQSGAVYQHQYTTTEGIIPLATWDATPGAASTLLITGYTTFATATAAGNWGQSFGNVQWNCTALTANTNLSGLLTTVNGDLIVTATGAGPATLRFANTTGTIDVAGSFNVSGNTEVAFCSGVAGTCVVNVAGDYTENLSAGFVRLAEGNNGVGTLNVTGNFTLQAGTFTENGGGAAQANINFVGDPGTAHTFTSNGVLANNMSYSVADDNELTAVGESQLAGGATSFFTLGSNAIFYVQSTDAAGAIQLGTTQGAAEGNLQVTNANRIFNAGSQIIYNGSAAQFMGAGHPAAAGITTIIDNAAGVTQVAASTISMSGDLILQTGNLTVSNAVLTLNGITDLQAGNLLFTSIGTARTLTINGDLNLGGDLIVTSGTQNANVVIAGDVTGSGVFSFSGINSNLVVNGAGDLTLPLSGATTIENITTSRSGVLIISDNLTVTNSVAVTGGTLQTDGTLSVTNDIILSTGNLDANGAVVLTDDLTLGVGTIFYFEDQSVTLNNVLTNNGGFFSSNSGSTLNITGTGVLGTLAFDPSGNTLGTFVLNRVTGTDPLVTLNSALTVDGTFSLTDGIFRNTSGLNFDNATVTRNSAASFSAAPLSVAPTGTYDLFLTGGTMTTGVETLGSIGDVSVTSSGTVTLGGAMVASGNVLINTGTFLSGVNAISSINFTNNGTSFTAPSTTLSISGDLVNNGAFVRNNGTVDFTGISSISGSVNPTFQNITISGTLNSPATLNLTGNFTNNGVFNEGTGTVVFTNTANGTKTIGGTDITTFNNLTIQNNTASPDVSISGNAEIQNALTLSTNAILDADGAGSGVLTLLSTDDSPTADGHITALSGTSTVTGNFTVQRYLSGEGRIYRYISSPVQGASVASWQDDFPITGPFTNPNSEFPIGSGITTICGTTLNPASASMFFYNEATKAYVTYPSSGTAASNALQVGRGYTAFIRECTNPTIIDVTGTMVNAVNSGNVVLPVTHTATVSDYNNLVGNPYPSQIDWDLVTINGSVSPTIAIRDNGTGSFRYHTRGAAPVDLPNGVIAIGQAFWVRTTAAAPTVTVTEASKSVTSGNVFFREKKGEDFLSIEITGSTQTFGDKAYIVLHDSTLNEFDKFDAPKMNNKTDSPSKELIDLYTQEASGRSLALNFLPSIPCGYTLPLVAKDISIGTYTFNFDQVGVLAAYGVVLTDNFTSTTIDVTANPSYAFSVTSNVASKSAGRFVLTFTDQEASLDLLVDSEVAICGSSSAKITIYDSQPGMLYFAQYQNSTVSDTLIGNGTDLELSVVSDAMVEGNNAVTFKGIKGCSNTQFTLMQSTNVIKNNNFTQAEIVSNGNVLESNYAEGNQWFFNEEEIVGATSQTYEATASGLYSIIVTTGQCTANAKLEFVITGEEELWKEQIQVYPNPFKNKFKVEVESTSPVKARIFNAVGLMVSEKLMDGSGAIKSCEFDLSGNTDGIYILEIQKTGRVEKLKIIKSK